MNRFALSLVSLALLACSGKDNVNLTEHPPEIGVSPTSIDFGEVVVGHYGEIGITVQNTGYSDLTFDSVELSSLTSGEYSVVAYPESLGHNEEGVLSVRYTPDAEGEDFGEVHLVTNDEVTPDLIVPLTASGVRPAVDIDPESLAFGIVPAMTLATQSVNVGSGGSGDLVIFSATVEGAGASYFTFSSAEYYDGVVVPNGTALTFGVTFAPLDDLEQTAELHISTNDPENELGIVTLSGNVADDPNTNSPPEVEITGPNNGEYFVDNVATELTGHVTDSDDDVQGLVCTWSVNGTAVALSFPDPDGNIVASEVLPAGVDTIKLECQDDSRDYGNDTVVLTVWEHDEPMQYVISGGSTEFDYITVDDDIAFEWNGASLYGDVDNHPSNLPPISFNASVGDTLRVTVTDDNQCDTNASEIWVHFGTGASQQLSEAICMSSCPDHACYDGTYNGPWPLVVMDETYTISIP